LRPSAFGGCTQKNGIDQAIGRSRGGVSTKIHACVDALGNPLRLILTGGQEADVTQGAALVSGIATQAVIADKGYDSNALIETIDAFGAQAIIPPRSNRKTQRKIDWHRYKARNLVERFFNRLKQFRRLATRYDKLASRFNAFLQVACAYILLL
jgi:transposase